MSHSYLIKYSFLKLFLKTITFRNPFFNMKKHLYILLLLTYGFSFSQLSNNAFNLDNDYGDLRIRRYISGDLIWKRALVSGAKTLHLNYGGDFEDGTRLMGKGLFVDGNVGIGTNTPSKLLEIRQKEDPNSDGALVISEPNNSQKIYLHLADNASGEYGYLALGGLTAIRGNGKPSFFEGTVGIGTTSPSSKLDVNGKTTVNSLNIDSNNETSSVNGFLNKLEFTGGGHGAIVFHPGKTDELMFGFHTNGNFYWGTGRSATKPNYYAMYLDGDNGDLGIKGKLTANEVKVKVGGWADYVFKNDYRLPTLSQVENHINEKGHLINIPSAKEVDEKGIDLGEMNKLFLEKIEELTLYTIDQERQLKEQKNIIQRLKEENKLLKSIQQRLTKLEKLINQQ